ncbi:MAG: hypothetical protein FJ388_20935, partial [Verrucomicrobia bacterium]|nr:hypothetical protein [Verrucomicrobiota bacterium]
MEARAEIGVVASILLVAFLLAFHQSGEAESHSYAALRLRILTLGQTITSRCEPALAAGDHAALQPLVM